VALRLSSGSASFDADSARAASAIRSRRFARAFFSNLLERTRALPGVTRCRAQWRRVPLYGGRGSLIEIPASRLDTTPGRSRE